MLLKLKKRLSLSEDEIEKIVVELSIAGYVHQALIDGELVLSCCVWWKS